MKLELCTSLLALSNLLDTIQQSKDVYKTFFLNVVCLLKVKGENAKEEKLKMGRQKKNCSGIYIQFAQVICPNLKRHS